MDDGTVRYVDCSNIDEFMFEITGKTHRGFFWKTGIRLRWKVREWRANRLRNKIRTFFHKDLQSLRSGYLTNGNVVKVRFTDKHGDLFIQSFRIKYQHSGMLLTEVRGSIPIPVTGTKGPRTLKKGYLVSSEYYWLGLRKLNVWRIGYTKTL